jgi:nitrogen fixation/metabolism regulation signal transduction histidine kinase
MTKAARWAWLVTAVALTGVVLVLGYVLALSTETRGFYERNFVWLFWLNVAVASLLLVVIVLAASRLALRTRRGKFGSRLLLKLAGIFALVGVLPGALVYTVSYQFVSRSIEIWFDAKVEGALDAGVTLGRVTLDAQVSDIATRTRQAAERLGETRGLPPALTLERLRRCW